MAKIGWDKRGWLVDAIIIGGNTCETSIEEWNQSIQCVIAERFIDMLKRNKVRT